MADGVSTSTLTTTVLDKCGNPAGNLPVTYSSTGTGNLFSPAASGVTDASGLYSATLSSTVAQIKQVHSAVGATSFALNQLITFNPGIVASRPAAPTGLTATGGCTGPVALGWSASINASS